MAIVPDVLAAATMPMSVAPGTLLTVAFAANGTPLPLIIAVITFSDAH